MNDGEPNIFLTKPFLSFPICRAVKILASGNCPLTTLVFTQDILSERIKQKSVNLRCLNFINKMLKKKQNSLIIYTIIAEQSRKPYFFSKLKISNNFDGRLEILSLNLILILWSLKKNNVVDLSQELMDIFFQDLDNSLRELGVSDLSVGKKIKILAENFFGRLNTYTIGFEEYLTKGRFLKIKSSVKKNIKDLSDEKILDGFLKKYVLTNIKYFGTLKKNQVLNGDFQFKCI